MPKHPVPHSRHLPKGLTILHEDRDILVIDKPAGLLTIGTDREKDRTAYFMLMDYVRKGNYKSRNRVFIVHRLDRETSGVLVFARTEEAKARLQSQWDATQKTYLAVVQGHPVPSADTISTYLVENQAHIVYTTADPTIGKLSHTAYRTLRETKAYALLEVALLTGRKNQIRVHLSGIGHPIVGDRKYGPKDAPRAPLALLAWSIVFDHPYSGRRMTFSAPVPPHFHTLVGRIDLAPPPAERPNPPAPQPTP